MKMKYVITEFEAYLVRKQAIISAYYTKLN